MDLLIKTDDNDNERHYIYKEEITDHQIKLFHPNWEDVVAVKYRDGYTNVIVRVNK